jgi:hypothetical protein
VRELERYGAADQIDRIEMLFAADSAAVLAALPSMQSDATLRWQTAAWGTDRLITDLGIRDDHKLALLEHLCREYGSEIDAGRATREALARKTRETRRSLDAIFDDATLRPWQPAYDERSRVIASLALRLDREPPFEDGIVASILHLHLNRVLRSKKREQERVLYDLLARRERSLAARAWRGGPPPHSKSARWKSEALPRTPKQSLPQVGRDHACIGEPSEGLRNLRACIDAGKQSFERLLNRRPCAEAEEQREHDAVARQRHARPGNRRERFVVDLRVLHRREPLSLMFPPRAITSSSVPVRGDTASSPSCHTASHGRSRRHGRTRFRASDVTAPRPSRVYEKRCG